ncbi:uncharacterized protein N7496_010575 [Penicillium cataractarum]|uniref:Uncharacterized protein n=1 Tax=Penicillium cataractarum TaxID=2100454 RepID=A0A9W9RRC6_9EURO|nr:uncharacterized protein N7496_010575 [Penicillium cataractarum]KAJ5364862.1 hypothetical protein N7496_010575 [Penicillium cataractarum]
MGNLTHLANCRAHLLRSLDNTLCTIDIHPTTRSAVAPGTTPTNEPSTPGHGQHCRQPADYVALPRGDEEHQMGVETKEAIQGLLLKHFKLSGRETHQRGQPLGRGQLQGMNITIYVTEL